MVRGRISMCHLNLPRPDGRRAGYSADDKSWEVMVLKTGSSSKDGDYDVPQ